MVLLADVVSVLLAARAATPVPHRARRVRTGLLGMPMVISEARALVLMIVAAAIAALALTLRQAQALVAVHSVVAAPSVAAVPVAEVRSAVLLEAAAVVAEEAASEAEGIN